MAGTCSVAPAGTDRLDLEAAEQLIQLSGGDDAGSETRSADSVKCRGNKDENKEEAAAVESRRRSAAAGTAAVHLAPGKDAEPADDAAGKEKAVVAESRPRGSGGGGRVRQDCDDGGVVHGEARRRPRFRSLADIYRETRRVTAGGGEGHAGRVRGPPPQRERKEKKRAADEAAISVGAKASKERRLAR
ncbi:hypothetical protein BS78_09G157700 [Paspalum vaginatum]|nr:hypothetical protein BS78_09G157700 [Paspalum vaginatum]